MTSRLLSARGATPLEALEYCFEQYLSLVRVAEGQGSSWTLTNAEASVHGPLPLDGSSVYVVSLTLTGEIESNKSGSGILLPFAHPQTQETDASEALFTVTGSTVPSDFAGIIQLSWGKAAYGTIYTLLDQHSWPWVEVFA